MMPTRGASFETYAGIRIRGAIVDEIRKGDWVPRSVHRNARRISQAIQRLKPGKGATPGILKWPPNWACPWTNTMAAWPTRIGGRLFSLDEMTETGAEVPLAEHVGDDESPLRGLEQSAFQSSLADAIEHLPEREKIVLALYYQEELNLKEIGAVLGVTESRVSQIHSQAALRLRARLADWAS